MLKAPLPTKGATPGSGAKPLAVRTPAGLGEQQARAVAVGAVLGADAPQTASIQVKTKSAHAFTQKMGLYVFDPESGRPTYRPIPLPPLALANGSARCMLRADVFPWMVHELTQDALLNADSSSFESLMIMIPQSFDAAPVNLAILLLRP